MKKIAFVLTISFFLALSCGTPPAPVEEAAVAEVPAAEDAPAVVAEAPPAPPPVRAEEPAFDPGSISQEVYDSTLNEVKRVIEELNKICTDAGKPASAERSYAAWLTWVTDEYTEKTRDTDYLVLLSQQPALKSRNIVLNSQRDYFINVFAASRQNVKVDEIEFVTPHRVKVLGLEHDEKSLPASRELQQAMLDQGYQIVRIRNQNRMVKTNKIRYYVLEKIDDQWKIASLDDE
jgi:hypothetical protein